MKETDLKLVDQLAAIAVCDFGVPTCLASSTASRLYSLSHICKLKNFCVGLGTQNICVWFPACEDTLRNQLRRFAL